MNNKYIMISTTFDNEEEAKKSNKYFVRKKIS